MKMDKNSKIGLALLSAIGLGGLGYYFYTKKGNNTNTDKPPNPTIDNGFIAGVSVDFGVNDFVMDQYCYIMSSNSRLLSNSSVHNLLDSKNMDIVYTFMQNNPNIILIALVSKTQLWFAGNNGWILQTN